LFEALLAGRPHNEVDPTGRMALGRMGFPARPGPVPRPSLG
jgi:hypothetical protein